MSIVGRRLKSPKDISSAVAWKNGDAAADPMAAGRKLGIRLWIMLRDEIEYDEFCRRGRQCGEAHAERPGR